MGRAHNKRATIKHHHVSEAIVMEILARLPLRSISRFKSVCKTWKSATESVYFRRLFVSLHKNSSSSWSLMFGVGDIINLHRCETWDLPKSLACYIQSHRTDHFNDRASSNGLIYMYGYNSSFVGNPILQQWVRIPSPPDPCTLNFGLATRVDEDGVVLGFKLVRVAGEKRQGSLTYLAFCVYSSETGVWSMKHLACSYHFTNWGPIIGLNGTLYFSRPGADDPSDVPGVLIAHDFYGESDTCRVIPLPDHDPDQNRYFKRALTTSAGSVMYIKTLANNILKVWMLTNNDDWQLLWEIRLLFITCDDDDDIIYYAPLAMNPFDRNLVYLWSHQKRYLVSCNLRTQSYQILREDQPIDDDDGLEKCFVNHSTCEELMNEIFVPDSRFIFPLIGFVHVLPRWMESLPCPPQLEVMDTTSLLSCLLPLEGIRQEKEKRLKDIYGQHV